MYYIYGQSGPSLLIESTDSMIGVLYRDKVSIMCRQVTEEEEKAKEEAKREMERDDDDDELRKLKVSFLYTTSCLIVFRLIAIEKYSI